MRAGSTQEERLAELRQVVKDRAALVVVGAGVSFGATNRQEALWNGLLRHGVQHVAKVVVGLDDEFADRHQKAIATGRLSEMLGVARLITRELGDRQDPRYRNWLSEAISGLKPEKPDVLAALRDLDLPLTTTNYDGLLEDVCDREPLTWQEPAKMLAFLRDGGRFIGHLHGYYREPESVVLDEMSYLSVLGSEAAQAIQQSMALFHSLIFVGCGAGLADPNFGGLLAWLRQHFPGTDHRHYRLCLKGEVEALEREHAGDRIAVVSYDESHDELPRFLRELAPAKPKRARQPREPAAKPPAAEPSALTAYRTWALGRFGHLEMIGVGAGELKLELSKIYVPLRLGPEPRQLEATGLSGAKGERGLGDALEERTGADLDLLEIFRALPREAPFAVILGEPGAGKTTALRKLLFHLLSEGTAGLRLPAGTVPFLLRLRRLTAKDVDGSAGAKRLGLGELIDRELSELGGEATFGDLGSQLFAQGKVLLLLDGLDEVADEGLRAKVCRYLEWELDGEERRGVRAVISCRRASYDAEARLDGRFCSFDVRPLGRDEGAELVRHWYREAARWVPSLGPEAMREKAQGLIDALASPAYAVQQIQKLVGSPLLLTLLCVVVLRGQEIPRRRTTFYEECLRVLLRQWGKSQERPEPVLPLDVALAVLRPLAYELHRDLRREDYSKAELLLFLHQRLAALGRPESPREVLSWLVKETGVLVPVPPHDYAFAHLGLQEYLAALAIAEDAEALVPALAAVAAESWWREVIELLAGLPRPKVFSKLMEALLASPVLLSDLSLLSTCLAEAEQVDLEPFLAALADEVPAARKAAVLRLLKGRRDAALLARCRQLAAATPRKSDVEATDVVELAKQLVAEAERVVSGSSPAGGEVLVLASPPDMLAAEELAARLEHAGRGVRVAVADGSWQAEIDALVAETRAVVLVEGAGVAWQARQERALLKLLSDYPRVRVSLPGAGQAAPWPQELPRPPAVELGGGLVSEAVVLLNRALGWGAEEEPRVAAAAERVAPGTAFTEDHTGIRFLWVPPRRFPMGASGLGSNSQPVHPVEVSAFWLAETAVTNRQYGIYLEQGGSGLQEPAYWRDKRFSVPEQPVVGVSWDDAKGFCRWLAEETKLEVVLPSEAQWEYAARGPEGRKYPWGEEEPDPSRAHFGQDWQKGAPVAVGSFPAGRGPFGHLDLAGNVWEWCRDEAEVSWAKGEVGRVLKGGGWSSPAGNLRSAIRGRNRAWLRGAYVGFRVAVSPPSR